MAMLRGSLAAFDSGTYRADVWLDGAATRLTTGLAVSRALPSTEVTAGRRVLIETGGQPDPAAFVVIAVWD